MNEHEEKAKFIADHYGYDAQSRQCMEECGELVQAINKYWRAELDCGKTVIVGKAPHKTLFYDNLVDELADVHIMVMQLSYLLGADLKTMVERKLDRQIGRISKDDRKG